MPRKKHKRSPELQAHFDRVCELGPHPFVYGEGAIQLHHCHSGSMADNGYRRGFSQKASDWLVIALPLGLHTGRNGIHIIGVRTWEKTFITQYEILQWQSEQLGLDLLTLAKEG